MSTTADKWTNWLVNGGKRPEIELPNVPQVETDLNDGTHSRFDFEHYKNCQPCYDDHLDFEEEQRMDELLDNQESESE